VWGLLILNHSGLAICHFIKQINTSSSGKVKIHVRTITSSWVDWHFHFDLVFVGNLVLDQLNEVPSHLILLQLVRPLGWIQRSIQVSQMKMPFGMQEVHHWILVLLLKQILNVLLRNLLLLAWYLFYHLEETPQVVYLCFFIFVLDLKHLLRSIERFIAVIACLWILFVFSKIGGDGVQIIVDFGRFLVFCWKKEVFGLFPFLFNYLHLALKVFTVFILQFLHVNLVVKTCSLMRLVINLLE